LRSFAIYEFENNRYDKLTYENAMKLSGGKPKEAIKHYVDFRIEYLKDNVEIKKIVQCRDKVIPLAKKVADIDLEFSEIKLSLKRSEERVRELNSKYGSILEEREKFLNKRYVFIALMIITFFLVWGVFCFCWDADFETGKTGLFFISLPFFIVIWIFYERISASRATFSIADMERAYSVTNTEDQRILSAKESLNRTRWTLKSHGDELQSFKEDLDEAMSDFCKKSYDSDSHDIKNDLLGNLT